MGSSFSSDVAMYKKLQKAAADLGADAVIVSGQSQSLASPSGVQSTVVTGNTAITKGGPYAFSYPKNQGLAIKYIQHPGPFWASANLLAGRFYFLPPSARP
jgi:hypothetical protein